MRLRSPSVFALFTTLGVFALAACGSNVATGGSGGGAACASFLPPEGPPWKPVTVRFTNTQKVPLYLGNVGGCGGGDPFTITDANGTVLLSRGGPCAYTCADLQKTSCACAADCAAPVIVYIAPGASLERIWQGSIFTASTMPTRCFSDATCGDNCLIEEAPTGKLTFSASLWTSADGCDPAACSCDPGLKGTCEIIGPATVGGTETKGTAVLNVGADTSVDLAF